MAARAVVGVLVGLLIGLGLASFVSGPATAEKDGVDSSFYFDGVVACGGSPELAEDPGCHADPESDLVEVVIAGPDFIVPSETGGAALFTATANTSIAGQQGAGINVLLDAETSTSDCELDPFPTPEAMQLVVDGNVLSHRNAEDPGPLGSLGVYSYEFLLANCTVPGTVRLLVAMNTFNFDGESTGDAWNKTERTITVPEPLGSSLAALAATAALAGLRRHRRAGA